MAVMELWRRRDLEGTVKTEYIDGNFFTQDSVGNLVGVKCYKDGAGVALAGSVTGYCVLPSGETVSVAGTCSGNRASILVPQSALAYTGPLGITLKLIDGNTITTLMSIIVVVYRSKTDTVITPSSQIITDWANQISAALQEVEDASAAQDVKIADLKGAFGNTVSQLSDDIIPLALTWEKGSIDTSGQDSSSNTLIRSVGYTEVREGATYVLKAINGNGIIAHLYSDQTVASHLGTVSASATATETERYAVFTDIQPAAKYVRFDTRRYNSSYTVAETNLQIGRANLIYDEVDDLKTAYNETVSQLSDNIIPVYVEWEKGSIDDNGQETSSNTLIRSVGFIGVRENGTYTMKGKNGNGVIAFLYSDQDTSTFIGTVSATATATETERTAVFTDIYPAAKYVRFGTRRYSSDYTVRPENFTISRLDDRFDDLTTQSKVNREYASDWGYGYLGLAYQAGDGASEEDRQLLMYLSPNGMDWYKVKALDKAPIRGWDYSTIYRNGVFYIAFDYKDESYGTWIDTDTGANGAANHNRGSNRIGIMRTSDFENWEITWVDLTHTENGATVNGTDIISAWAPEWYTEDGDFYLVYAQAKMRETATTVSGAVRYLKNQIIMIKLNSTFDGVSASWDITPSLLNDPFVIDPSLIKKDSTYYLQFKNERRGVCRLVKATASAVTSLSHTWTDVHEFVGKSEGMVILYDNITQRYLAYSDLRFTNAEGSSVQISRQQYALAVSKDMENWSELVAINVQGDAPLRHFTPCLLNEYSAPRVKAFLNQFGNLDGMVDETKGGKCYDLIAQSDESAWQSVGTACDHYTAFLMQAGAVYRVTGGSIQVDDVDLTFMRPGEMCTFVIADAASSITFASGTLKTGQAVQLSGLDRMMLVVCTNANLTRQNGRVKRSGTEARAVVLGG